MNKQPHLPTAVRPKTLATALSILFALALIMGPGPGLYLVNPNPHDPQAVLTIGNVPILYLWVLFWFAVQASVVLVAYFTLWQTDEE